MFIFPALATTFLYRETKGGGRIQINSCVVHSCTTPLSLSLSLSSSLSPSLSLSFAVHSELSLSLSLSFILSFFLPLPLPLIHIHCIRRRETSSLEPVAPNRLRILSLFCSLPLPPYLSLSLPPFILFFSHARRCG